MLKRKTKAHRFSWLVFVIMNGIVTLSQYLAGRRASVLISLSNFVVSSAILLLALKYGTHDISRFDRALFAFALLTIAVWIITRSNTTAIWLPVVIGLAATAMTLLKIKAEPYSEDPKPWAIATGAYVCSCLALANKPFVVLYARPVYGLAGDALLVGFIFYCRRLMGSPAGTKLPQP